MSKNVNKRKNSEVLDYGEHIGSGYENQTQDDISIPFISVLQGLSPQLDTIEGAKPGMLFNTVTEELLKDIEFVPALTTHSFVEWVPRDQGGGFVAVHEITSDVVKKAKEESEEFGKYKTLEGNDLVESFYAYVILTQDDEPIGMAVIAFTSTKIKIYKRWNTRLHMFTIDSGEGKKAQPPLFAHRCRLKTIKDKSPKGEFYNFVLTPAFNNIKESLLPPGHPIMLAAIKCREMVNLGIAKASYENQNGGESTEEDIPF